MYSVVLLLRRKIMIVFDLDNTLRKTEGDYPYTPFGLGSDSGDMVNWVTWQKFVNDNGVPIEHIVKLYHTIYECDAIVILTSSQFGTREWLCKYDITIPDGIEERSVGNNLSSTEYKKPFIDENKDDITLWVDDCIKTCDYVESLGIPVVRVLTGRK